MKMVISLIMLLLLSSCASTGSIGNNEAYVITPNGDKYLTSLRSDSKMIFADGDVKFEVDNRGREGLVESLLKLYGLKVISDDD